MSLYYLIYKSHALIPADSPEHNEILAKCQHNNGQNDITGFLHRERDFFLQYLEGPKSNLEETLKRISRDPRHESVEVLGLEPLKSRHLPDWQMGFVSGEQLSLAELVPETAEGEPDFDSLDPFDLVVFMVANSQSLSATAKAA